MLAGASMMHSPYLQQNMQQTGVLAAANHHLLMSAPAHPRRSLQLQPTLSPNVSRSKCPAFSNIGSSIPWMQPMFSKAKLSSSPVVSFGFILRQPHGVSVRASSVLREAAGEHSDSRSILVQTLEMGLLFGTWYLCNIYFNIYNKQVLKVFPYPITITSFLFFIGTVLILLMWGANLYKKPKFTSAQMNAMHFQVSLKVLFHLNLFFQLLALVPLVVTHTFGNLSTNMSIGKVAVSFTHTIKAMEPFFSVLFSAMFLGETPTFFVVSSLVPIVGGVALASFSEASFNWVGFSSAMASNVINQSRNVFSKRLMKGEDAMDNINMFSVITIMSFLLLTPVALFRDGVKVTPGYLQSAGLNMNEVYVRSLLAGLCFHASQQVSYMILGKVSPVTHSVGNCVKRVVVIVTSVIFFRTPVSPINALGTGIALAGVFLYSRMKRIKPKAA